MDVDSVSHPNMGDLTGGITFQNLEESQNVKTPVCESCASKQKQMCFIKKSAKKVVIERFTPAELPPGWIKEIKVQKMANKTRKDPYYTDPVSGNVFRSLKDALRYLETGNFSRCAIKPRKRDELGFLNEETSVSPNTGEVTGGISSRDLEGSQNVKTLKCSSCVSKQKQMELRMHSVKKVVIERVTPDGLPPGWIKEIKIEKKANGTRRDPYYTDPASGYVFRSQKDALRYLETGDFSRCATKPKKREELGFLNEETFIPSAEHLTTRRRLFAGTENSVTSSIGTTEAKGSQKRQCTSASAENGTVSTPSTEILREENLEEKGMEKNSNIIDSSKSKDKKALELPRRSSKRLAEVKLKMVAKRGLSEQAHRAGAAGKSGESEVPYPGALDNVAHGTPQQFQTVSETQIADHALGGTEAPSSVELSDTTKKPLEDQAVPEDQPARQETEKKDEENLGSQPRPSGDSWSDPCLDFAFKTLTGAISVENNVAIPGYFQEQVNTSRAQSDGSLALPEFGVPYLPNFFQNNISSGFDAPGKPVSVPQLPTNPTFLPTGNVSLPSCSGGAPQQPNLEGNKEHQPKVHL